MAPPDRRLLGNGLLASVQVVWTTAALFMVFRIVTGTAGIAGIGLWSTAVAISAIAGVADCGLTDLMVRQVAEARGRGSLGLAKHHWLRLSRFAAIGVGLACILILPLVQHFLAPHAGDIRAGSVATLAAAAVVVAWFNVLNVGAQGVLEAFGRYDLKLVVALLSGAAMVSVGLVLRHGEAQWVLPATFLSGALTTYASATAAAAFLFRGVRSAPGETTQAEFRGLVRSGVQLRLAGLTTFGLEPVTRMFLLKLAGPASVGCYEIAYRVVFQLRTVLVAGLQTMVPRLAFERAASPSAPLHLVAAMTRVARSLCIPVFGAALLAMPALATFVAGQPTPDVGAFCLPLALGWSTNVIAAPAYFANIVENRVSRNLRAQLVMVVVNVLLGVLLGQAFGAIGIVIAIGAGVATGSAATLLPRAPELRAALDGMVRTDVALATGAVLLVTTTYLAWLSSTLSRELLLVVATTACLLLGGASATVLLRRHGLPGSGTPA